MKPKTRYAKNGGVSIAYQVFGQGPLDLVYVPGWISHVEYTWEQPACARLLERLSSFARVIMFDKRGTGLSDRDVGFPTLEERMDDVRAVMDTVGSERAALLGTSEGGNMSVLFAATYPERVVALVVFGIFAKRIWSPDYPWAPTPEQREGWYRLLEQDWGGVTDLATLAPSRAADPAFAEWWATFLRMGASPSAALTLARTNTQIDVRAVLPAVRVSTLVLHRRGDRDAKIEEGRYIAAQIPHAELRELEGEDHLIYAGDVDGVVDEIEEFLTGVRPARDADRVLATILFTDIVDSTVRAADLGDHRWQELLGQHHRIVRQEIERLRGREVNSTGDGFVATFDGPARAIRCALATAAAVQRLGLQIRAGIHTGECELREGALAGIALHICARISALAGPGEILVSRTVHDLVAGAGIGFADRGVRTLRGVPGEWPILAVTGDRKAV
ncbi:MAG TPA: adenylate/guanylate cyclase domain-containing protein [Candidatus Angelobacter sp.]|nr:adenylate/guanylate cyclase domain-containing protein [Candidatus Angelobacter sp.]